MRVYAWTVQLKRNKDYRKKQCDKYEVRKITPKIKVTEEFEKEEYHIWNYAHEHLKKLIRNNRVPMGIIACFEPNIKTDSVPIAFSACSSSEPRFNIKRGIDIASGKLRKKLAKITA